MSNPFKPLAGKDDEPAFAEPWQAQVLALAHAASAKGAFTPTQWANALGAELHRAPHSPDERTAYYEAALHALEILLRPQLPPAAIERRAQQWRQAYLTTPHGQPVELL